MARFQRRRMTFQARPGAASRMSRSVRPPPFLRIQSFAQIDGQRQARSHRSASSKRQDNIVGPISSRPARIIMHHHRCGEHPLLHVMPLCVRVCDIGQDARVAGASGRRGVARPVQKRCFGLFTGSWSARPRILVGGRARPRDIYWPRHRRLARIRMWSISHVSAWWPGSTRFATLRKTAAGSF